eukprot:3173697-Amphidinium_carterae.1
MPPKCCTSSPTIPIYDLHCYLADSQRRLPTPWLSVPGLGCAQPPDFTTLVGNWTTSVGDVLFKAFRVSDVAGNVVAAFGIWRERLSSSGCPEKRDLRRIARIASRDGTACNRATFSAVGKAVGSGG